jgi:hypothetical protein
MVMVYLRKERIHVGNYKKMKLKKIGPCKILRKFSSNAYEIELASGVGISPIFNVADFYSFKETKDVSINELVNDGDQTIGWKKQLPRAVKKEIETILYMKVPKKIRGKEYFQYLVKWKGQPTEDSIWMTTKISKYGANLEDPMNSSFLPRESDAGESNSKIESSPHGSINIYQGSWFPNFFRLFVIVRMISLEGIEDFMVRKV